MNVAETIIEIDESGTSHIVTRGYPLAVSLFVAAKAEPFRALVVEVLALDPDLVSVELLRRAKLNGDGGGKTVLDATQPYLSRRSSRRALTNIR